eukprot:1153912-Pelagomonas_calceolata.AAC.1
MTHTTDRMLSSIIKKRISLLYNFEGSVADPEINALLNQDSSQSARFSGCRPTPCNPLACVWDFKASGLENTSDWEWGRKIQMYLVLPPPKPASNIVDGVAAWASARDAGISQVDTFDSLSWQPRRLTCVFWTFPTVPVVAC